MDQQTLGRTRRALHGVAELVLAGPQYTESREIRLRVTPGGFGTVTTPDLRVAGPELVSTTGRVPLAGTFGGLAAAVGVEARALRDVYADGPGVGVDDVVSVDPGAATLILAAFAAGDAAMRDFAPGERPVLWPEHFDLGISLQEVNYGVSPGDDHVPGPTPTSGRGRPGQAASGTGRSARRGHWGRPPTPGPWRRSSARVRGERPRTHLLPVTDRRAVRPDIFPKLATPSACCAGCRWTAAYLGSTTSG